MSRPAWHKHCPPWCFCDENTARREAREAARSAHEASRAVAVQARRETQREARQRKAREATAAKRGAEELRDRKRAAVLELYRAENRRHAALGRLTSPANGRTEDT